MNAGKIQRFFAKPSFLKIEPQRKCNSTVLNIYIILVGKKLKTLNRNIVILKYTHPTNIHNSFTLILKKLKQVFVKPLRIFD